MQLRSSDALDGAVLVNGLGNIYLSNWNADRGIRINADGSIATIGSGGTTFNGLAQINGSAGGANTYLQLLNNGSAIGILGSDTSISGGNAAEKIIITEI